MTTVGDIIYEATGPAAARLPIGTTGQILTVSGGIPSWQSNSSGPQANGVIYENNLVISANYTLSSSKNGFSVGPITINSGVAVTVPSGQRWVVL